MSFRKNGWTKREDQILASTVLNFISSGKKFNEAYNYAANLLGRTKDACEYHWRKNLKQKYKDQLTYVKSGKSILPFNIESFNSFAEKLDDIKEAAKKTVTNKAQKVVKNKLTQLEMLVESVNMVNNEELKVFESGKNSGEYVVLNNENEFGYWVLTKDNKVLDCNCQHRKFRDAICKHMVKVALEKKFELF